MPLIGISAKAGCGKTTMAGLMVHEFGFTRRGFGDALKEECSAFTGLPLEYFYIPELKESLVTVPFGKIIPRKFMQWWGTEFRRTEDQNYWLARLWEYILLRQSEGVKSFVVDDVRFTNEALFILQHGGIMVRLDPYKGYVNTAGTHTSETDLDDFLYFDFRFSPEYGQLHNQAVEPLIHGLASVTNRTAMYAGACESIRRKEARNEQETKV